MPYLALRPGYWFRTGKAVICSPQEYVKEKVAPMLHRAWVRKPPAPPRGDQVVAPASDNGSIALLGTAPDNAYNVAKRIKGALKSMDAIVDAAERVTRQGRDSARRYPPPLLGPPSELADTQPRLYWIRRYLDVAGLRDSALGLHCLTVGRDTRVQEAVRSFVSDYGPLIVDFGGWCCDAGHGPPSYVVATGERPASLYDHLGEERLIWPRKWRLWGRGIRTAFEAEYPVWPWVPAPVGFYVWGAYIITALRDNPSELASQVFLANRLASLRLASEPTAPVHPVTTIEVRRPDGTIAEVISLGPPEEQGPPRTPPVYLFGELLDYLALAVAYRSNVQQLRGEQRAVVCESCGETLRTSDGRRRYCDYCSKPNIRDAVRQQRRRNRNR